MFRQARDILREGRNWLPEKDLHKIYNGDFFYCKFSIIVISTNVNIATCNDVQSDV
jgi:hypothetical protein